MKKVLLLTAISLTLCNTYSKESKTIDTLKVKLSQAIDHGIDSIDRLIEKKEFSQIRVAQDTCDVTTFIKAVTSLSNKNLSKRELRKLLYLSKRFGTFCAFKGVHKIIRRIENKLT